MHFTIFFQEGNKRTVWAHESCQMFVNRIPKLGKRDALDCTALQYHIRRKVKFADEKQPFFDRFIRISHIYIENNIF
jgi:hypothetical protein